jgi:hypothetical protein
LRETTEIELNFNRKDFEEVYFNGNQGSYVNSETTKKPFRNMLAFGLIFFFFLFKLISDGGIRIGTIILGIIFLYFLVNYLTKAIGIWKRKKTVEVYLNGVEKIKSHKLILNKNAFGIQQENEIVTEFWTDFKRPEINDMFIYLVSKSENYLIPKKSMTELEYEELKSIIRNRINNE